jgi:hypothetical protein
MGGLKAGQSQKVMWFLRAVIVGTLWLFHDLPSVSPSFFFNACGAPTNDDWVGLIIRRYFYTGVQTTCSRYSGGRLFG